MRKKKTSGRIMETHELFTIQTRQGDGGGRANDQELKLLGARKGPRWQRERLHRGLNQTLSGRKAR